MFMISTINRIHVQGTSCLAVLSGVASAKTEASSDGRSPRKFTPVPGVHKAFYPTHFGFPEWAGKLFVRILESTTVG